jgi:hypothetical protein
MLGKNCLVQWSAHEHMNPPGFPVAVKAVTQVPLGCGFLDDQARETKFPFINLRTTAISHVSTTSNAAAAAKKQKALVIA